MVMESSNWAVSPRTRRSWNDFRRNAIIMKIDSIVLREVHMPLLHPFETSFGVTRQRRILLAEVQSEGLTGWGECTAGEHPFFSGESTDTAWQVMVNELGPMLAAESPDHGGQCPRIFRSVRGNPMAKASSTTRLHGSCRVGRTNRSAAR